MDKKLLISFSIFIALILFYFYDSSKQSSYQDSYTDVFKFDHSKINKVIILKNSDGIEIERADSSWKINGHDSLVIKSSSIDKLFNEILKVKINSLELSKNANNLSVYSLDSTKGVNLILLDESGSTLSNVVFGISTSNYSSNFFRKFDSKVVYTTNTNVSNFLTTSPKYWGEPPNMTIPDSTAFSPSGL